MEWELFWFEDREDFRRKVLDYPGFLWMEAEHFLLFDGETVRFRAYAGGKEEERTEREEKEERKEIRSKM